MMTKKSEICSGCEIFERDRIELKPFRYRVAIVCLPLGRKAMKKCVEQRRDPVIV